MIQLIECPRDAMQGWPHLIPTQKKIEYINALLEVGFDAIDFGSFVSPKAIPQMPYRANGKNNFKGWIKTDRFINHCLKIIIYLFST